MYLEKNLQSLFSANKLKYPSFSFKDERTEHSTFFVGDFQSDHLTWQGTLFCPHGRGLVVLC